MKTSISTALIALITATTASAGSFTAQGNFSYRDKEYDSTGWTGVDPVAPIRRADVIIFNLSTGLAAGTGTTDQNGNYSIQAFTPLTSSMLMAICTTTNQFDGGLQSLHVTDLDGVAYAVISGPVPVVTLGTVNMPPVIAESTFIDSKETHPFNVFDMAVHAFEYVDSELGQSPHASTVDIKSPAPKSLNLANGTVHISTLDGYDDAVILHEVGHRVQSLHSKETTPGGNHVLSGSDQDPRLSFSEGFATAFGGAVLSNIGREPMYADHAGAAQIGGFGSFLRLENAVPLGGNAQGAASESGVACVLFDILDDEASPDGFAGDDDLFVSGTIVNGHDPVGALWAVFTGQLKLATYTTMADFWDRWLMTHMGDVEYAALQGAFSARNIVFWPDAAEIDSDEAYAQPITPGVEVDRTLYDPLPWPAPFPGRGDIDWFEVDLVIGSEIDIATYYPAPNVATIADTVLELYRPNGVLANFNNDGGSGRNAKIDDFVIDETGTWKFLVRSGDPDLRPYGRYSVELTYEFENELPEIVSVTVTPQKLGNPILAAIVQDAQSLTYQWTPLSGGAIIGNGAQVEFAPPAIPGTQTYKVRLVVTDTLGATSTTLVTVKA